jgi:hypothetical protein
VSTLRQDNRNNERWGGGGGRHKDPPAIFIAAVKTMLANRDTVINHRMGPQSLKAQRAMITRTTKSIARTPTPKCHNQTPMHEGDAFRDLHKTSHRIGSLGLIPRTSPARGYCWGRGPEATHRRTHGITTCIKLRRI